MFNYKDNYSDKALVVTTVASTLDQFCMNDVSILQKSYKVQVAANFSVGNNTSKERIEEFKSELQKKNIKFNEINFNRNPFSKINFFAYKEIKKLINSNSFKIIHCHTPIAAMIVRLASRKSRKKGTKVIYTAHGFHFFKGAPVKNWMLFYPIERWLARYTDVLITINKEDYNRAKKSFKAGEIKYIHGVGVDIRKFSEIIVDKSQKRKSLGLPDDSFIILSVGELNKNKNHETVINAIAKMKNTNVYYIICGQGLLGNYLKDLIKKLDIEKQVRLLGFRRDVAEICKASDVFAFPSYREGLPVALMEAMSSGLPVICSDIRGNNDLIEDGKGGYLVNPEDIDEFADCIKNILTNSGIINKMIKENQSKIKEFSIENVSKEYENILSKCLKK